MEKTQLVKYLQNAEVLNSETLPLTEYLTQEYPWFQTGWMLYIKNLKQINSSEFEQVLKKVAVLVPDRKQLYKFLNGEIKFEKLSETCTHDNSLYHLEDEKIYTEGDSLIDRFLRIENGGFKRLSAQQSSSELSVNKEFIEKSIIENNELVSETLANIYFQQKKYEKALQAYHKLSLKYPEKSIYFASRIKEIEDLKNNK